MASDIILQGGEAIEKKLLGLKADFKNAKEALKDSGEFLVQNFVKNFETEGSTLQSPWAKLAPSTIAQKIKLGYGSKGILERTGKLKKSIQIVELNNLMVRVGSNLDYYKTHQVGGGNIPRRKMVDFTPSISKTIVDTIRKFLLRQFIK